MNFLFKVFKLQKKSEKKMLLKKYLRIRNQQVRFDIKHILQKNNKHFLAEIKIISVELFLSVGRSDFFTVKTLKSRKN